MLVADEQGYYFHDIIHCYRRMIYATMQDGTDIHIHDIRYFVLHRNILYLNYVRRRFNGHWEITYKEQHEKIDNSLS